MESVNGALVAAFLVAAVIEMAAPLVLAVVLARRMHAKWKYFWLGALTFLLFQGVTRIPAMIALQTWPAFQKWAQDPVNLWMFLAFAAITAGLFEEGGRWIVYRYAMPPKDRIWRQAVMFGAGHGGLESFGIGCLVLLGLVNYLLINLAPLEIFGLSQEQVAEAKRQFAALASWTPLLGAWERLCTIIVHIAFSILVLWAFVRGFRWWWCALAAHAAVDFVAVGALQIMKAKWGMTAAMLGTEALVGVMALAALGFIVYARRHGEEPEAPQPPQDLPLPADAVG